MVPGPWAFGYVLPGEGHPAVEFLAGDQSIAIFDAGRDGANQFTTQALCPREFKRHPMISMISARVILESDQSDGVTVRLRLSLSAARRVAAALSVAAAAAAAMPTARVD